MVAGEEGRREACWRAGDHPQAATRPLVRKASHWKREAKAGCVERSQRAMEVAGVSTRQKRCSHVHLVEKKAKAVCRSTAQIAQLDLETLSHSSEPYRHPYPSSPKVDRGTASNDSPFGPNSQVVALSDPSHSNPLDESKVNLDQADATVEV